MRNKRPFVFALLIIITVSVMLTASACGKVSYGEAYDNLAALKEAMTDAGIVFKYPVYMGETDADSTQAFVSVVNPESGAVEGCKIYSFGAPFFVSVAAYNAGGEELLSDDAAQLTQEENLLTERGEAKFYIGKGYKDGLFLIGAIILDGKRYELRVTANKETQNNNFVNAIYKDNARYAEALDVLKRVIEGIEE